MTDSRDKTVRHFMTTIAGCLMQAMGERAMTADQLSVAMGWPVGRLQDWLVSVVTGETKAADELTLRDLGSLIYELDIDFAFRWRMRPEPTPETPPEASK